MYAPYFVVSADSVWRVAVTVAGVDREDSSVVGGSVTKQHAADDPASAGRVQWISQPAQAAQARGEREAGDDV